MSPREDLLARAVAWFATNGVGDTSLRTLGTAIGTSHRMLIYHFGSRAGLLAAVVEEVERSERAAMEGFLAKLEDPYAAGQAFWVHVADAAQTFAPLYFELSGHAMQGAPHAVGLRQWLGEGWLAAVAGGYERVGHPPARSVQLARLSLAMARGLLFELAVTGDRLAADEAMEAFTVMIRAEDP